MDPRAHLPNILKLNTLNFTTQSPIILPKVYRNLNKIVTKLILTQRMKIKAIQKKAKFKRFKKLVKGKKKVK